MKKNSQPKPEFAESVAFDFPEPVVIDGVECTEFVLTREPRGNDLGGHTFADLLEGNIRTLAFVTPKIIQPYLHPRQIKEMPVKNIMALNSAYGAFLEGVDLDGMVRPSNQTSSPSTPSAPKAG